MDVNNSASVTFPSLLPTLPFAGFQKSVSTCAAHIYYMQFRGLI